jgi:N utilization substance protein B
MSRRRGREYALQMLYQQEVTRDSGSRVERSFWDAHSAAAELRSFAGQLFGKSLQDRSRIDALIQRHCDNWKLGRISAVDRNVLRMGVAEFLYLDTPKVVVISEAIEIARKFGTGRSAEFVNGILDAIRKELDADGETG